MVKLMYEALFQTPDRPFRATPDVRFYFPYDSVEQTRQTVLRVVRRAEGPAAVMGGAGLGKSLLAQLLAEDLKDRFDVVRLHAARLCSRRAMLQNILFELKLPYRDLSEGELRLSLMERMEPAPQHAPDGIVLIVDEAQTLPTKLLEELRLVTNFARQGQARARMVLLGSMHLEETFALPEMSSFNQRLAARCFLQPMSRTETADFVRHQFHSAGVDAKQIITRDALENVYVASEGIPRLANQVMDHALILAITNDQYPISAALVQEAWSDLQQLPMSWNQHEPTAGAPVEFGSIDDLDQDFELEPEGVDELANVCQSQLDWPASSDLEDFGPGASCSASHATTQENWGAQPADTAAASMSQAIANQSSVHQSSVNQSGNRVVLDASKLFNGRMSADSASASQAANSANSNAAGSYAAGPATTEMAQGDQDLFLFQEDEADTVAEEPVARNMFASWTRANDAVSTAEQFSKPAATHGRTFTEVTIEVPLDRVSSAVPMPLARVEQPSVSDPFGEDFDEEFAVDASDVRRWQERQRAARQAQQAHQAAKSTSAAAPKHVAPELTQAVVSPGFEAMPTDGFIHSAGAAAETLVQPQVAGPLGSDFVSVTSGAADEHLQQEIEDLISQLNFSAFSVEMDSVEQISPEFTRSAAGATSFSDASSSEHGAGPTSHPIRREEQSHSIPMTTYDDDRDLLIIEEEVPASVRHANVATAAPALNTVSYPQLFQQLRG